LAPDTPLREAVLAGDLFHDAAGAIAAFPMDGRLADWFGAASLACVLAHDGTAAGRADALERLGEAVDRDIARLDAMLTAQLEAILGHERLRRLEGSWRGVRWLVGRLPPAARIRVRILVLRWPELCRDFDRAAEFDQSQLFRKVYEDEFGTPGGEPFGLLCGDWEVRPNPAPGHPTDDVAALAGLAAVAAAAFSPTVVAAHPALFGLDTFSDLGAATDLIEPLRGPALQRWRRLQEQEDTRFLAVLLPRVLARAPWPDDGRRADRFRFRPDPGADGARVWMSPVYAMAAVAVRAFAAGGWPADLRGATVAATALGGVVDRLPDDRFPTDPPGGVPRPPVDVALTDAQERQAVEAGLVPLVGLEGLPEACFGAIPSLHRPPRMMGQEAVAANANQRLSAQFNALLCASRFAHCVKLMGRDMVGGQRTPAEIEDRLARWLLRFTSTSGEASGEAGARHPLRDARVAIAEKPGRPGVYGCTIQLLPHYQLDEVGAAFRLVTDLEAPRSAAA